MNKFLCKIILLASLLISSTALATEQGDMRIIPQRENLIESMQIGEIEITLLSEGNQAGNTKILLNASAEDLAKYLPGNTYTSASSSLLRKDIF